MTLNNLSISCDGSQMPFSTSDADIVYFDRMYQLPSPEQIKLGLDMNNFLSVQSGNKSVKANEYNSISIGGLTANSTYVIFATLSTNQNGMDIYSLKDEIAQMVVQTLSKQPLTVSAGSDSILLFPEVLMVCFNAFNTVDCILISELSSI